MARSISLASRYVERADLHPERRRHGLNDAELGRSRLGMSGSPRTATRLTLGAICLSSSSHFPLMLYSKSMKPVALPPGRARLSTNPPPTGSAMIANTIGTVRVACSNCPTVVVPGARMTSGASAANSAACLRIPATLFVAQRISIRTLRPSIQPSSCSACRNAPTQADSPDRPRVRPRACRYAASARPAARAPSAATPPPRHRAA